MKTHLIKQGSRGMNLFELFIVVAVVVILAAILLPALSRPRPHRSRATCVYQLKQVGLAFRIWQGDNNDKYPMSVSVTNGGTMELVASGLAWQHFEAMSNELNSPKILMCIYDQERYAKMASEWRSTASAKSRNVVFRSNLNTSYFIGVDADYARPEMILAGDRNLTLMGVPLAPGLHSLTPTDDVGWGKELHNNSGNVLMADGSVQSFKSTQLRAALSRTGAVTNRLAVP